MRRPTSIGALWQRQRRFAVAWPFGATFSAAIFAALACAAAVVTWPGGTEYATWVTSSASIHECLLLAGPVLALYSAAAGFWLAGHDSLFFGQAVGRRIHQLTGHTARISGSALLAILLGTSPNWIWAAATATWGGPSLVDVFLAAGGVIAITAVSFVAGSLLPRLAWIVAAPWLCLAVLLLPRWVDRALSVLDPVQSWTSSARFSPNPAVAGYFLVWVAFVTALSAFLFEKQHRRRLRGVEFGAGVVTMAVLVTIPFIWRPDLYTLRHSAAPVCTEAARTAICFHPAHKRSLTDVTGLISRVNAVVGGPIVARVTDEAASDSLASGPGEVLVAWTPGSPPELVAERAVFAGTGQETCLSRYPTQSGTGEPSANLAAALGARVLADAGDPSGAAQMAAPILDERATRLVDALTDRQLRRIFAAERHQMEECSLTFASMR